MKTISLAAASAAMCAAACADVPFNALRFGSEFTTKENWPGMRAALEKNRGGFDEVWFSTGTSFPALSWHEERAKICASAAEDLRRLGIVPSIEIQTIIGHTDGFTASQKAGNAGQNWGTWVGYSGAKTKHISCPRDPRLAEYFARVAELYAAWKPGSIWIDDDVTLRNRAPGKRSGRSSVGCYCERCLAEFSRREGRTWTREALADAVAKDGKTCDRWWSFTAESLAELVRKIVSAAHKVSPETRYGYQFGWSWDPKIVQAIREAGGHPVRLRPGAGAYYDTDPHAQLAKAYELQSLWRKYGALEGIEAVCPEIESWPRSFCCRTAQGIILEAFENLALGMDFVSMFVADARHGESVSFYSDRLFPRIASAHSFLKSFRDDSVGSRPCGFSVSKNCPAKLQACRGVPIAPAGGASLGPLPKHGSMQTSSGPSLMEWAGRCDKASGGRLPVLFDEPVMLWVMPRVTDDGSLKTLAVVNASIDRIDSVGVRLRGVKARTVRWHAPGSEPVELPVEHRDGFAHVVLPRIAGWSCGYLSM